MLFSVQIVVYLFLGGTAGGVLLISCLARMASTRAVPPMRKRLALETLYSRCILAGLVALAAAILCLIWDLGHPERVLYLFVTERPNILTIGVASLSIDFVAATALVSLWFFGIEAPQIVNRAIESLCAAASLTVIVYTGVYLYSLDAVGFWHTPAIIALFLLSSLSAGTSGILLVLWFTPDNALLRNETLFLRRIHLAFVTCEALAIAAFLGASLANPNAARSLDILYSEEIMPLAVVGIGGMALSVPFVTEAVGAITKSHHTVPASDLVCLVGGLLLRYCIVFCGTH